MTHPPAYDEQLVTGEAVALNIRTAGIGSRGVAVALDFMLQIGIGLLLVWLVENLGASMDSAAAITMVLVAYVVLVLGYPVGFETLWRGRTPGKAALGLRVVRDDGGPIRFRHAFVRGLVGVVLERPGALFFLPALVCMLVNKRSKRLGDLAGGTVVMQERVPSKVAAPPPMPPALASWAATLDLTRVDDRLAHEVRQFLARAGQLAPSVRDAMAAQLVAETASRTAPPPAGVPEWAYLSAVLAERRRRDLERVDATQAAEPAKPQAEPSPGPFAPPS